MPGYMRRWIEGKVRRHASRGHFVPLVSAWGNQAAWSCVRGDMEFQADTYGSVLWKVLGRTVFQVDGQDWRG